MSNDNSPNVKTEQELFLDETEKLIEKINGINQRMAGIPKAVPRRPEGARVEAYRKLYDERRLAILRIEEINKLCIEKGYITA